ncbi:hypothetical protein MMC26_003036 [Xylographa opegraphella]|nr:hypothetical protein [Xylographa opegraphella]
MSLVGNFAFGNYDKTAENAGSPQMAHRDSNAAYNSSDNTSELDDLANEKSRGDRGASIEDLQGDKEVHQLARRMTEQSITSGQNPFDAPKGSSLDPNSENFSSRAWAKSLLHLQSRDPEKYPTRTSGVAFRNLSVHGFGAATDYQKTVSNIFLEAVGLARRVAGTGQRKINILRNFDGLLNSGEMLMVLGPPGSGCSTLLKTIAGETHGLYIAEDSYMNYQGISAKHMHNYFRGEAIYTAEVDVHFPQLSVGDTLSFAAQARAPRHIPGGVSRKAYAEHRRDVVMAMFGISHTLNTRVGNDFVRGVSGGERKRVSIAEATLSASPLQCWDNSTRGLDSANALEFCRTIRMETELMGSAASVAIYQASQSAYDIFDKVVVLYEGYQIYFGPSTQAKQYFIDLGFHCPERQTTADFLTSMTSPIERIVRSDFESKVPRTPEEFARAWKDSSAHAQLMHDIEEYEKKYTIGGEHLEKFRNARKAQQAKHQRIKSPYTLSYGQQVALCLERGFMRLKGDPSLTFTQLFGNFVMALIIGSVFYNLQPDTSSFYSRGALLFFAILINAFGSALEILTLYAQRPIVEKHQRYALYHPSAEAFASMLTDLPYKIMNAFTFNLALYFMTNLRREPGAFFFFVLISFFLTLTMSMLFRTIAATSRTLTGALAPAAVLILAIIIYTGFVIPTPNMLGWARWINYLDPIAYGFEALMINEFSGRTFACSVFVPSGPGYGAVGSLNRICSTTGSAAGASFVDGDAYINTSFQYFAAHKWRNFGIILAFMFGLMFTYLIASELISAKKSKGEVLVFQRGHVPAVLTKTSPDDVEASGNLRHSQNAGPRLSRDISAVIQKQTAIFQWHDVCYDIKIKGAERRILDHVDGWVKPGTLTALMGVSGAGKTTLLDVLATRVTMGVVSGEMLVDGRQRDESFQRKTGYVQQQDLHLATSTVREALNFSALLRQPTHIPRDEKLAYVDEVIKILDMQEFADAVVGVPGEGLNVEQRKRLTIGVELAAKPQLLLFLDEPTSGLDSQTSWAICDLMEKLTRSGQAILCTIHQPSAMLFQRFDRLLFLASGGKTVYFGEVGKNSSVLTEYFRRNGASPCPPDANPAEWMLEVIGAAPGTTTDIDWHQVWRNSPELAQVHKELATMKEELPQISAPAVSPDDKASYREFAAPFGQQMREVLWRVFQQYWRTPSYIYSKATLCIASGLFIGFSFFRAENSQQGVQNQLFSIFMLMTIFGQLTQQIMPHFVTQRSLYEVRERPSKAYSWKAFMLSNIIVELPWNSLSALLIFVCWYYPIGLYRNAEPTNAVHERGGLMFLFILEFLLFTSTFTNMVIAGVETAETGGNIANLIFSLSLVFCGVLASPTVLPGFWIFMYRVSPFTYLVSGMLATAIANTDIVCSSIEFLNFEPTAGKTCHAYMAPYIDLAGGYLQNPSATANCSFCAVSSTNTFLAQVNSYYDLRWRNFGIMWAFIVFNVFAALLAYWALRVPKNGASKEKKSKKE